MASFLNYVGQERSSEDVSFELRRKNSKKKLFSILRIVFLMEKRAVTTFMVEEELSLLVMQRRTHVTKSYAKGGRLCIMISKLSTVSCRDLQF